MRSIEAAGKSIEEAKEKALAELGVAESDVTIEVVKRPGTVAGLFGGGEYRVKVTVSADLQNEKAEAAEGQGAETVVEADTEEVAAREIPAADDQAVSAGGESADILDDTVALVGRRAQQAAEDIARMVGVDNVRTRLTQTEEREVCIQVDGDNPGLLIGRHGETLDALQLIVAIAANKGLDDGARVIVDAEDYRNRHTQMIEKMARSYASEAKEKGQEVVMPDLKAYERRIVHMTLRDDPDVETYSEGEGAERVLVISPKGG